MRWPFILLTSLLLSYVQSDCIASDSLSQKLTGKWLLTKHLITDSSGSSINILDTNLTCTFEFFENGTYQVTYDDKRFGRSVDNGKWKISPDKTKLLLFDIVDVPDDPLTIIADHDMPIISITAVEFVTQEYFSEASIGTSYYVKQ